MLMDELIIKPKNSLINQSVQASEMEEPLNGDGFGVAWYNHDIHPEPGLFVSVRPAWNDQNLGYLAQKIKSNCFFAHVRAANVGWVSEVNCHPFHYKNLAFMHNGQIGGFQHLKRHIRNELDDEMYNWIKGQTDSEHLFALFLHFWNKESRQGTAYEMADVLQETIGYLMWLSKTHRINEKQYLNLVLTDGRRMVSTRFTDDKPENASTLYYSKGSKYTCEGDTCRMRDTNDITDHAVLIVSERLTTDDNHWHVLPSRNLLIVDVNLETSLQEIKTS
jgi:predicted glutamine amidotransferase